MERAVRVTCESRGYLLVRGPPGSGKKTELTRILNLLGYKVARVDENGANYTESLIDEAIVLCTSKPFQKTAVIFSYPSECPLELLKKLLKAKRACPIFFTDSPEYHPSLVVFDRDHVVGHISKAAAPQKPGPPRVSFGPVEVFRYDADTEEYVSTHVRGHSEILPEDDEKRSSEAFELRKQIFANKRFLRVEPDAAFAVNQALLTPFTRLKGAPVVDPRMADAMSLADTMGYSSIFGNTFEAFTHICPLVSEAIDTKYAKDPVGAGDLYQSPGPFKMPKSDYYYALNMGLVKPDVPSDGVFTSKNPNDTKRRRVISAKVAAGNAAKTHPLIMGKKAI